MFIVVYCSSVRPSVLLTSVEAMFKLEVPSHPPTTALVLFNSKYIACTRGAHPSVRGGVSSSTLREQ